LKLRIAANKPPYASDRGGWCKIWCSKFEYD